MKTLKTIGFYILSFTWGLPMSLLGSIIAFCLLVTGHKPKLFHYFVYFEVGCGWGGFECGCFFFVNKNATLHLKQHEAGHGLQNIMFGVFMPFIVTIPSAIRYWYREVVYKINRKKYFTLPEYDSIWFEGQATKLGKKYFPKDSK